ncbi:hypothetical protein Ddye_008053 [Dipteronia dyeriana]|uniref:Uncharacterized protein n=1 Tax=Dipteronia dyeriana TaxID=168575 RepID=A0AAE0CL05_9ROSI|nr:hypothetical protein Ddye_008053 [Dipteronia dyeriana]
MLPVPNFLIVAQSLNCMFSMSYSLELKDQVQSMVKIERNHGQKERNAINTQNAAFAFVMLQLLVQYVDLLTKPRQEASSLFATSVPLVHPHGKYIPWQFPLFTFGKLLPHKAVLSTLEHHEWKQNKHEVYTHLPLLSGHSHVHSQMLATRHVVLKGCIDSWELKFSGGKIAVIRRCSRASRNQVDDELSCGGLERRSVIGLESRDIRGKWKVESGKRTEGF